MTTGPRPEPGSVRPYDPARGLIVFDGICVLCSGFVRFVCRRDTAGYFQFALAQDELGQKLYARYGLDRDNFETNLVIIDGTLFVRLDAFVEIMRRLGWPYRALVLLKWLPRPIKDWCYNSVARNRYALFGKRDQCGAPSALADRLVG
ncbi:MAG: DCC1-like thiol-disulfide oxidoreductase family protein [Pseudomonadota bacterium]